MEGIKWELDAKSCGHCFYVLAPRLIVVQVICWYTINAASALPFEPIPLAVTFNGVCICIPPDA